MAEIIRDYVKKGAKLYVEGRIQTRSWDDQASGQKKYRTEIIVNDVVLLSGRGEGESGGGARARIPLPSINGRRCTTRNLPAPKSPTTIFPSPTRPSTRRPVDWPADDVKQGMNSEDCAGGFGRQAAKRGAHAPNRACVPSLHERPGSQPWITLSYYLVRHIMRGGKKCGLHPSLVPKARS